MRRNLLLGAVGLVFGIVLGLPLMSSATAQSSDAQDPLRDAVLSKQSASDLYLKALTAVAIPSTLSQTAGALLAPTGVATKAPVIGDPIDGAFETYYEAQSSNGTGFVDVHSGRIIALTIFANIPTTTEISISAAEAGQIAESFLETRGIPTAGLNETVRLIDHGQASDYDVEWTGTANGALVPDNRSVWVNPATGFVAAYADNRHPYSPPPSPSVKESAAVSLALAKVGATSDVTAVAQLKVTFTLAGHQRLVWSVSVTSHGTAEPGTTSESARRQVVEVDALDGTATLLS